MPVFTAQVTNLESVGPILDVQVSPSVDAIEAILREGGRVPSPISISAMIDTGASASVMKEGIAQQLGLNPVGVQRINTPSTRGLECPVFYLQLILDPTAGLTGPVQIDSRFIEAPLEGQNNLQALLGRDILRLGVFIYNGATNSFVFSF